MKTLTFRFFFFTFTFILAMSLTSSALAHGDEPRLEISVDRINPGGVIDVRGVDFEREEAITLMLVNAQSAIPLGEIIADVEGVFLQTVVLPVELAEGTYNFLAITDDHNITSPDLTVQGSAITASGEGEEGRRDEEDPLLAAVPTYPHGVVPGVAPGATQVVASEHDNTPESKPTIVIGLSVIALGAFAFFLFVLRRKR